MDVAWLILDSLSYEATSFGEEKETTPKLKEITENEGILFTNAYVPGPSSPSSHGSFFTGKLPTETKMTEANPYFDQKFPTIADSLDHKSLLITPNPFLFNGLQKGFDQIERLEEEQILFDNALNPAEFVRKDKSSNRSSRYKNFLRDCLNTGKPLRSIINGLWFKYKDDNASTPIKGKNDEQLYQFANTINSKILDFLESAESDALVVANYMDIHAPLDASDESLELLASDYTRDELPIGTRGQTIHDKYKEEEEYRAEDMYQLYKAAVRDLDAKVSELIEKLIERDILVIVTADHGNWFRRDSGLEERRIHVPLIIFDPNQNESKKINETVNLIHLPKTTVSIIDESAEFNGRNLLELDEDLISITEYIREKEVENQPVSSTGTKKSSDLRYDIAAIKGDSRIDYLDGKVKEIREGENEEEMKQKIKDLTNRELDFNFKEIEYEEKIKEQLRSLGYE